MTERSKYYDYVGRRSRPMSHRLRADIAEEQIEQVREQTEQAREQIKQAREEARRANERADRLERDISELRRQLEQQGPRRRRMRNHNPPRE